MEKDPVILFERYARQVLIVLPTFFSILKSMGEFILLFPCVSSG